ncbi:MAG TPA: SirB2 family protein [Steroidobacter sp.]|uniref:SirB2 family protein n=1 Tax=Steroidobacter sp. TaxID=1978227 RepID=UPI002EDB7EE0
MIEFYPQIKMVHVAAVIASGSLFLLRGAALHAGMTWVMAAPLRYLSYAIDTTLLTAALMLATVLHQYPFVHSWLTVKVLLLVVYIGLGSFALKRGSTRKTRVLCWLAALLVYVFIISVARYHHPAGVFAAIPQLLSTST